MNANLLSKSEVEEVRKIFDTQVANGQSVIKLNPILFEKLLAQVERGMGNESR